MNEYRLNLGEEIQRRIDLGMGQFEESYWDVPADELSMNDQLDMDVYVREFQPA